MFDAFEEENHNGVFIVQCKRSADTMQHKNILCCVALLIPCVILLSTVVMGYTIIIIILSYFNVCCECVLLIINNP